MLGHGRERTQRAWVAVKPWAEAWWGGPCSGLPPPRPHRQVLRTSCPFPWAWDPLWAAPVYLPVFPVPTSLLLAAQAPAVGSRVL